MFRNKIRSTIETSTPVFVTSYAFAFALGFFISYLIGSKCDVSSSFVLVNALLFGALTLVGLRCWLYADDSRLSVNRDDSKSNAYVICGGLLAFVAIVLVYLNLGVYPFGDRSVLIIDMHHQYVAFFASLRDKFYNLFNGDSFLYSGNVGLGSGYISLFAYYLSSPFNILILLFPREYLTEAIALITVLKIACAGLTFAVFVRGVFKRNNFSVSILSCAYALSAYMLAYSWDVMWLDSIILLPLTVYGLHLLLEKKKPVLYVLALAGALITNYYIGYMICVFLVLYFIAYVIINSEGWRIRDYIARAVRFAVGSLLGGGIGAFLLIPTFIALQSTSGADDLFNRDLDTYFNIFALFGRSMFSASPSIRGDSLPNIYCSVLAVVLIVIFFLCKGIPTRLKVAAGGLLGVMCALASINWTYFAMHGFHFPNDLPHRFAFLIVFCMLYIGAAVIANIEKVTPRDVGFSFFIVLAGLALTEFIGSEAPTFTLIYVSLLFVTVYCILLGLRASKHLSNVMACLLLIAVVFIEIVSNGVVTVIKMRDTEVYTMREDFTSDYDVTSSAVKLVESYNQPQYRIELLPRKTCNDASLFGYSGLTVFASSNTESVIDLMGYMGYANNGVNSHMYRSFVPLSDSILNLKYLIFNSDSILNHAQLNLIDSAAADDDTCYIYKNEYALSRGFVVDQKLLTDWNYVNLDPFAVQNSFISAAVDAQPVYKMLYPAANAESTNGCSVSFNNSAFHAVPYSGSFSFTAVMSATDLAQHYIYVDCRAADNIQVACETLGGSTYSSPNEPYIIDLGTLHPGDEVRVTVYGNMECTGNIFVASMDDENFKKAIEQLGQYQLQVETYKETRMTGTIQSDGGLMFTSIPYDKGWTVTIDGEKVDTLPVGNALLAFEVPSGSHTVRLSYYPAGLAAGIVISVLSLLIFAALALLSVKKHRDKVIEKFPKLAVLETLADPSVSLYPVKEDGTAAPAQPQRPEGFSLDDPAIFEDDFDFEPEENEEN